MSKNLGVLLGRALLSIWSKISQDTLSSLFFALYVIIALATFRHSSYGFASIERGSIIWGAMSALAVDIGMMLSATGLRKERKTKALLSSLLIGLMISALASIYTQLLFAVMNAQVVLVSPGASWMQRGASWIIEKRILIMPALLPVLSIVYSFSAKENGKHSSSPEEQSTELRLPYPTNKNIMCKHAWIVHGVDRAAEEIAGMVGCHVTTANRARRELLEEFPNLAKE